MNYVTEEPGLVQLVKNVPASMVKEEVVEDSWQDMDGQQCVEATSAPTIAGSMNVAADGVVQDGGLNVKEEQGDTDMDIGPTVLQNIDSHYITKQPDTRVVKEESTINCNNVNPIPCGGVKEETIEYECRGSLASQEVVMMDSGMRHTLPSLQLKIHKERLESICRVELRRVDTSLHANPNRNRKANEQRRHSADAQHSEETQPEQRAQSRLYRCDKCPQMFMHNIDLRVHCGSVHGTGSHECTKCNSKYKCLEYLLKHIRDVHSKQRYKCAGCKKMCKSKRALRYHVPRCPELRSADAQHNDEEQRAQPRPYRCDKCLRTFKRNNDLLMHCGRVHGTGSHECTECKLKYKCKEYLLQHMRNVHIKQQSECTACKKMCKSKKALSHHVQWCRELRPAGSRLRNYVCDYCQKTYKVKYSLKTHIASVHASSSYKCSQCNKTFKCQQFVTRHTARVHSAGMQECNVCGKSFKPHYLRSHILNMHCDKQLHCKLCAEVMKSKRHLRQHLKDCHGQKSAGSRQQFTCSKCGKNFTSKWNCQQHEKSGKCSRHTGSNTSAVASTSKQQHSVVIVKEEPADGELDLGPVVLQHMDCNYRPYKQEPQLD